MTDHPPRRGRSDQWMPFYIGDYLADTMRLTTVQHGAYVLLLMEYWRNGPLPNEQAPLAAIARCDRRLWDREIWPALRGFFAEDGGVLRQKRADAERSKAARLSAQRAEAANEKWRRRRTRCNGGANADASASSPDMQSICEIDDTRVPQSHSSLRSECDTGTAHGADVSGDCAAVERPRAPTGNPDWIKRVPRVPGVNC